MIGVLVLALALGAAAADVDGLGRLRADPSPSATQELSRWYEKSKDADQKFWILHALGARLAEQQDTSALAPLLAAAEDRRPELRQAALRALAEFGALPETDVDEPLLARLDVAVQRAAADKHPGVQTGAKDLERAIRLWREPESRRTPPPPRAGEGGGLLGAVRWLWVVLVPGLAALWSLLGFPVFDDETPGGRRAAAAWAWSCRKPGFVAVAAFLWFCLASLLAGYGFDILAAALGRAHGGLTDGWLRAYLAAVMCVFLPAALIAAGAARRPQGDPAAAGLGAAPMAVVLWLFVAALIPIEQAYRMFTRHHQPRPGAPAWRWVLEFGVLRAAYWTLAASARQRLGLASALARAREAAAAAVPPPALGVGDFDPRFTLLCAGPVLAFFCAFIARQQPVVWSVGLPVLLVGCAVWAWFVLSGVLIAVAQALEGLLSAARLTRFDDGHMPEDFAALTAHEERT